MNKRPKLSKLALFLMSLVLVLGEACTKKSRSPSLDEGPRGGACDQLNLVRDASWTASFVQGFVSCLSEGSESSREKFATTLEVLHKLGDQSLQSTLDLFRFQNNGQDVFFGLTSSILDRGADSSPARWAATQSLLEDTKPLAFARLLMDLKRRDLLNPLLDTLQSADDTLPKGFIEAGVRQFLTDAKVKADLTYLIKAFLADEEVFQSFNTFLTPERKALDPNCSGADCSYAGAHELKSSAQHWLDFWAALPREQRDRLALAMAQVMKGTLEQSDEVAMDRGQRLSNLAMETVLRSQNVYHQLYEALDVVLKTKLSSYQPFIQGLNQVKDNPIYLDAFQEKIGSTQLQDLTINFLWKGGKPQSCSAAIPGLSEATDGASRERILKGLLNANAECQGLSPVLVMMSEYLGYKCAETSCKVDLYPDASSIDPKALLSYHFQKIAKDLSADSFLLYRSGAARAEISPALWKEIQNKANGYALRQTQDLLVLEKGVYEAYSKVLSKDWLELSLNQTLQSVSELEQSFKGLYPDRNPVEQWYNGTVVDPDTQLARVVYGLYEGGSADQVLEQIYSLDKVEKAWRDSHPSTQVNRRDLAQLIAPLRSLSSQFRNPKASFKPELEKIALPWLGTVKNPVSFTANGSPEAKGDALSYDLLFDKTEQGLSLNKRYSDQLALATASIPSDEAIEFKRWMLDVYLQESAAYLAEAQVAPKTLPVSFLDRSELSPLEARTLVFFLGTQFTQELSEAPRGARINASPESNTNPRNEAARAYSGAAALGGVEKPWTSFWMVQNKVLADANTSLSSMRRDLSADALAIRESFTQKVATPTILSQGQLNLADADLLNDHEKLLLQLQLMSPILDNRKQVFVPSVGFDSYCPKRAGESWSAAACPFMFDNAEAYASFLDDRFVKAFCSVLPSDTENLKTVLAAMALTDTPASVQELCSAHKSSLRWRKDLVQNTLTDALRLGKNPRLKTGYKGLPATLRWLKAQERSDGKEILKAFLSHTPIVDSLTSATIAQRRGTYQAFSSRSPGANSVWLSYLSQNIGLRGISENLKRLGSQPISGSEKPVQDFLSLVVAQYDEAMQGNRSTLEFALKLLTEISQNPYARETVMSLLGKPYDPYTGILIGYTMPQAIEAGIFPSFDWNTYAPLRLLIQNQNLDLLQGLAEIYDRDALDWLDHWLKITTNFPSFEVMASDLEPMIRWLRSFAESRDDKTAQDLSRLASLRDWTGTIASLTRTYRLLRVSLPDLSNQWHQAFYFESAALSRTVVETLPRLLSLKDKFELEGGDKNLMPEALLGLLQGPLKHDGHELAAWLQDERMGFRAPSYWGAALRDQTFRAQLDSALVGFDQTSRDDWRRLRAEWDVLGPHASKLIDYTAKNVVLKNAEARYQKDALGSIARVTGDTERWTALGKVLDSWLDEDSVLKEWQTEFKNEKGQ